MIVQKTRLPVSGSNIDSALENLIRILDNTKAEKAEKTITRLLTEEICTRILPETGKQAVLAVSVFLGNVSVEITQSGEAFNPLEDSPFPEDDEQDYFRGRIINAYRSQLHYTRRNRNNTVTITVHSTANKQIRYTFIAMLLGIAAGFLIKYLIPDEVQAFINTNILVNIRAMFLNALKMMIAPLVFFSVVSSIAGIGNISSIGRSGGKF